jgi:hypothetical protein
MTLARWRKSRDRSAANTSRHASRLALGIILATCSRTLAAPSPSPDADPAAAAAPAYVGRAACSPCHKSAMERFAGSHHDRAMQVADAGTVLGDFNTRGWQ